MKHARQMTPQQRAALSVREFKKMLPGLTAFVRALTGRRTIRVEMGPQSGTDGRRVIIRPPMALADSAVHERSLCDIRDGNQLLCPACARLEEVYVVIYHEVSHNVAGSMAKYAISEMREIILKAAREHGSPEYLKFIIERANKVTSMSGHMEPYEYGDEITGFLLSFIRAIDDYRIDYASYLARPGVETMRHHQTEIILDKGMEGSTGEFQLWSEAPLEAQIPIAILVGKQGHRLENRFDDRIPQLFDMPVIQELLNEPVEDMLDVLYISVSFLGELNKLGLYDLPLPPPDMPPMPPSGEPEPAEEGSGDTGDSEPQNGQGKGSSAEGKREPSEDDSEDDSSSAGATEDTSQQGEKEDQDAGNGHGTGNGNSGNSDPSATDPGNSDSDSSDAEDDNESITEDPEGHSASSGTDGEGHDPDAGNDAATNGESGNLDRESEERNEDENSIENEDSEPEDSNGSDENSGDKTSNENDNNPGEDTSNGNSSVDSDSQDSEESDSIGDDDGDPRPEGNSHENSKKEQDTADHFSAEIVGAIDQAPDFSDVGHASAEEIREAMERASGHAGAEVILGGKHHDDESVEDEDYMMNAVTKALVFDDASTTVAGQKVYTGGKVGNAWGRNGDQRASDFEPMERKELSPSILHARRVFSDSKLDKNVRNLKRGKLASAKLGARAWNNEDDRLFQRKIRAQGIDDELLIAMDLSGSTRRYWCRYIKKTAYALADTVNAVGVKFSIYGHSTDAAWSSGEFTQHIYVVKAPDEPWGPVQKDSLARLGAEDGSLDGHNLEYYRKRLMQSQSRRKTLVYFTDGQIPETNHSEEVMIITRELALYKQLGINILVVAFGTDGPKNYGLDTIKIKGPSDIITVIREIEKRLTH